MRKLPKYGYGMKIDSVFADTSKSENQPISLNATKTNEKSTTPVNNTIFNTSTKRNNKSSEIEKYWLSKGFSENAVKGILANIHRESNFNSGAVGDKGTSFGMYQHHADRRDKLFNYLDSKGLDRTDPFGQTDFAISELSPSLKNKLNNASTPEEAADLWVRYFERPANVDKESKLRQGLVANYKAYGGNLPKYGFGENLLNNPLLKNANSLKGLGATSSSTNAIQNGAVGLGFLASGIDSFNNSDNPDTSLSTVSGVLKGAASGASIGSIIPGWGTAIGGVIGGVVGGISANKQANRQRNQYQENLRNKNNAMKSYFTTQSNAMLASYPTNGVQGSYGYFKYGGCVMPKYGMGGNQEPQYEVEKDEVVQGSDVSLQKGKQIASDMHKVEGNTHEQGGTLGSGGERVFSNRLLITDDLSNLLRMGGFNIKTNKTFADVATKLGKLKGKYEDKLHTNNHIKINTGKVMIDKLDSLTEITFQAQEQLKKEGDIPMFAFGGNLPKYADGGYIVKKGDTLSAIAKRNNTTVDNLVKINGIKNPNLIKEGQTINLSPSVASTITNPVVNTYDPLSDYSKFRKTLVSNNPIVNNSISNIPKPLINTKDLTDFKTVDSFDNKGKPLEFGNLVGYGTSLMGYMNDLNTIKRMDTTAPRNMITNPAFNYTDRSGIGRAALSSGFRSFVNNPNNNGTMNQMAFANYLKGINQNNLNEAQRKDDYVNNYNRLSYQTNASNTQTIQRADEVERSLKNEQNQMYGQAFNNLLGNVGTVRLENDQKRLDKEKMELLKRTYDIKSNQGISYMLDELRKKVSAGTATPQDIAMFKTLQG